MSCCKNDLGSFPHNKDIDTGLEADATGVYELLFTGPNYVKFSKYLQVALGDNIIIPQGTLNEDFQYMLVITKPDGTAWEVDACPNFSLKTYVNTLACADINYL